MDVKKILEQAKENDVQYIEELYYNYSSNEYHVICKYPNGRIYNQYNILDKGSALVGPYVDMNEAREYLDSHRPLSILIWNNPERESAAGDLNLTYTTEFLLSNSVLDFDAAYNYLIEDDMTQYALEDMRIPVEGRDKIEKITWILVNDYKGYVEVKTNNYLTEKESEAISDWISGQNSDGLMENFGDLFGYYIDSDGNIVDSRYSLDGENEYIYPEPDWASNNYALKLET